MRSTKNRKCKTKLCVSAASEGAAIQFDFSVYLINSFSFSGARPPKLRASVAKEGFVAVLLQGTKCRRAMDAIHIIDKLFYFIRCKLTLSLVSCTEF